MKRRPKRTVIAVSTCAAAAVLITTLLSGESDEPVRTQLNVPQAQGSELDVPKPPLPSTVSVLLPSPSLDPPPVPPVMTPERRPSLVPQPRPAPTTPPQPAAVDFQAEDARIHKGSIQSNHPGFTGTGFVDYFNEPGGSVEWTVPASTGGSTELVFRFANGSHAPRSIAIVVNQSVFGSIAFPVTNGWSDWRTFTIRVNLLAGTNKIRAVATTGDGGPNFDKITVKLPPDRSNAG